MLEGKNLALEQALNKKAMDREELAKARHKEAHQRRADARASLQQEWRELHGQRQLQELVGEVERLKASDADRARNLAHVAAEYARLAEAREGYEAENERLRAEMKDMMVEKCIHDMELKEAKRNVEVSEKWAEDCAERERKVAEEKEKVEEEAGKERQEKRKEVRKLEEDLEKVKRERNELKKSLAEEKERVKLEEVRSEEEGKKASKMTIRYKKVLKRLEEERGAARKREAGLEARLEAQGEELLELGVESAGKGAAESVVAPDIQPARKVELEELSGRLKRKVDTSVESELVAGSSTAKVTNITGRFKPRAASTPLRPGQKPKNLIKKHEIRRAHSTSVLTEDVLNEHMDLSAPVGLGEGDDSSGNETVVDLMGEEEEVSVSPLPSSVAVSGVDSTVVDMGDGLEWDEGKMDHESSAVSGAAETTWTGDTLFLDTKMTL